jgi:hypothetical protein
MASPEGGRTTSCSRRRPRCWSFVTSRLSARPPLLSYYVRGEWPDPKPSPGTHYYYVRVRQADGELAGGSPLWVELVK